MSEIISSNNFNKKETKLPIALGKSISGNPIVVDLASMPHLLVAGTTGSGKTIVYFNSLKKKINEGYQGLILLPEIGLTGEFQRKFKEFFGFNAAIWHSSITKKNKKIICNGSTTGKIKVLIGARSYLFLHFFTSFKKRIYFLHIRPRYTIIGVKIRIPFFIGH